jgi:PPM family protein phosphatase
MQYVVAHRSDVGRVRQNNEDNFLASIDLGLFVVADGMGGHHAGEVASQMTCDLVLQHIEENKTVLSNYATSQSPENLQAIARLLDNAINGASKAITKLSAKNKGKGSMGCTCTALLILDGGKGVMGHVGDSRLYMCRTDRMHQLTEDHTFVGDLVKRGVITEAQAKDHPNGNVITRAVGVQPTVAVDTMVFDIDPGDIFLLCSDGLYSYFDESSKLHAYLMQADPQAAIDDMVDFALEKGGHDNITALSVGISPIPGQDYLSAEQRIGVLKKIPLFAHLNYNELVKVLGLCSTHRLAAGSVIIKEGETGEELYVVVDGSVEVFKGENVLSTLGDGVHLGEMALIDNAPRSASARTKTSCRLLRMRRREFVSIIRAEPVIATKLLWSFLQVMSGRLRQTNDALLDARSDISLEDTFEIFFESD